MFEKLKAIVGKLVVDFLVNQVLTKENVAQWINDRLDAAVEAAKKTPETWDDAVVQKIHDIITELMQKPA